MYRKALKNKMRIATSKGMLSVEKVFDLSMTDLSEVLISLDKEIKTTLSSSLDFIESIVVDEEKQAQFDIVKDIYLTKRKEQEETLSARDTKAHNEQIMSIIARKREAELENLSIAELEAKLQ